MIVLLLGALVYMVRKMVIDHRLSNDAEFKARIDKKAHDRKFGKQDSAKAKLSEQGFQAELIVPLRDQRTFFAISRETPGVAVCNGEGVCEILPLDTIKDGHVSNVVETTIQSKGGMTGLEMGGVFLGSGGTNTTISDKVTQSWICLRVRDFDKPERWFCFASPEEARTQMNRIELLLESQESANL